MATAAELAEALWEGGVPRTVLQFVPCVDGEASRRLITHPEVDAVVLTGSWETARMFWDWRPRLALHAETSGKNAMVITATADLDEAIADLVHSAFGHAGQKCSAASLAIVEAPVYDDSRFLRRLADAVRSLVVGPAWDLATSMGPLIRPPQDPLLDAFTRLGPGERWLVRPAPLDEHRYLWSPGVKAGVAPGSPFHLTECFGPVLGIMRAADLDEAIRWQNQPAYGLTAGSACPRPRRDRPVAEPGARRKPVREPGHHRRHRAPAAVRGLEALGRRAGRQSGRPQLRGQPRAVAGGRILGDAGAGTGDTGVGPFGGASGGVCVGGDGRGVCLSVRRGLPGRLPAGLGRTAGRGGSHCAPGRRPTPSATARSGGWQCAGGAASAPPSWPAPAPRRPRWASASRW